MYDCASDVTAYHNEEVTLSATQQAEMRQRRDSNRARLERNLKKNGNPEPQRFQTQGSYAMRTMVQHDAANYDIDDAVFFKKADLVGSRGAEMTALDARKMVRDALDDGSFNTPPAMHTNCVRVQYNAGYQVDIPVFREVIVSGEGASSEETSDELASSVWKTSDAGQVTHWFNEAVKNKSPDDSNGKQLRRITKLIKKFANSRTSWESRTPYGFVITALVVEQFQGNKDREDESLYWTMKSIRDRLESSLTVYNPVASTETIAEHDDARCAFLRDRLSDAIDYLEPLLDDNCNQSDALKCWDKVYNCTFFTDRNKGGAAAGSRSAASDVDNFLAAQVSPNVLKKDGGGRFA